MLPRFPLALGAMNSLPILRDASFLALFVLALLFVRARAWWVRRRRRLAERLAARIRERSARTRP